MPRPEPVESDANLARATVAVVGLGGLGLPAAAALAAAGVGSIRLIDDDRIELSNLHRQLLYRESDLGSRKSDVALARLAHSFPAVVFSSRCERLDADNTTWLLQGSDVVIDATDNVRSKFCLNDTLTAAHVAFVHAGVTGLRGQLLAVLPGITACLRCVFPDADIEDDGPACQQAGVLGPLPALLGAMQAAAAIRILSGTIGSAGRLVRFDCLTLRWQTSLVERDPSCSSCAALT